MNRLSNFIKSHWEEALIWGVAVNIMAWAITTANFMMIGIVFLSLAAVIILVYLAIERASRQRIRKVVGENTAFKFQRRGAIFTVGKQTDTIAFAVENQKPDYVGLICTDVSESFADELISRFHFTPEETVRKRMVNPFEIKEILQVTNGLLDWMIEKGLDKTQIVVDVTGGMTTMSVGVFSAADDRQIDTQYIRSKYDEQNRVIKGTMEGVFITHFPTPPRKRRA